MGEPTVARLERELETLDARRAQIATALEVIRSLIGEEGAPVVTRKGPRRRKRKDTLTEAQIGGVRRRWERGEAAGDIAEQFGIKPGAVYYLASRGGWKRGGKKNGNNRPTKDTETSEAAMTPVRNCAKCSQKTVTDPCSHCGAAWERR